MVQVKILVVLTTDPVERFPLNLCHCIQATPFPFAATGLGEGCNLGIGIPHEQYSIPKQARLY